MEPPRLHRILSLSDLDDIDLQPEDFSSSMPLKKVPHGSVFEASRAGDVDRLQYLLDSGVNVNARDRWDSVALYYACLAGHLDAARMLLESGAICAEHTFDGDRCHYAALNLKVRKLLKEFEARPPPLGPLQGALRETFLGCWSNNAYLEQLNGHTVSKIAGSLPNGGSATSHFPADVVLYVQGRPIEAHRVILIARSPFFKSKFETDWKGRKEIKFTEKLCFPALFSLIHFFYCDRLEVFVDDIEALARICRVCKCISLQKILEKELIHQKYADYKSLQKVDNSQKRFILQGLSLPENDRLPAALRQILEVSLTNSTRVDKLVSPIDSLTSSVSPIDSLTSSVSSMNITDLNNDFADVYVKVEDKIFRCHQVVLASRSEYFKARLSRMEDFSDGRDELTCSTLPCIEEHDLSMGAFEKMVEYMYTDALKEIKPDQAEEMFDAASRYLLFPLKRAVADVLLPHLETADPAELCHWLTLADMYGVSKIREYCINTIALNFETFAETPEFRAMLLTLPPPSGDTSLRTTAPNAPGAEWTSKENLLDDLREKWLEAEGDELNQRDESALRFDKRLEMLVVVAEREKSSSSLDGDCFAETS